MQKNDKEMMRRPYTENMRVESSNIILDGVEVVNSSVYAIHDLSLKDSDGSLKCTVSETVLYGFQSTRGHGHADQEELYFFLKGEGDMQVGGSLVDTDSVHGAKIYKVRPGSVVLVPAGKFHRVFNRSTENLVFYAIFNGKAARPAFRR